MPYKDVNKRREWMRNYRKKLSAEDHDKFLRQKNGWRNGYKEPIGKCLCCGTDKDLLIHHIDNNGRSKTAKIINNDAENLIVMCRSCHAAYHINQRTTYKFLAV